MIAICGGGTGGHLQIARVINSELKKNGIKTIYIGSIRGQDRDWFENSGEFEKSFFLDSKGVVNKGSIGKILALKDILLSALKVVAIFKKYRVKKVFSVGGYSASPAVIASILSFKELYIHEQNAHIGALNKISKPFAKKFFSSFFASPCKNYPVKEEFVKTKRVRKELKKIIFLGGSQGAKAINDLAILLIPYFKSKNIQVVHIAGKRDFLRVKEAYKEHNFLADVRDFSSDVANLVSSCDFAISRAGASLLFELMANAIPTLFIPYPYAASNHQYFNAKFLVDKNMAYLMLEESLKLQDVIDILQNINLQEISLRPLKSFNNNGAECIVREILL